MKKKNHDEITDFVYNHCPASDIVGIMLTGSHADHTEICNQKTNSWKKAYIMALSFKISRLF